jgi:alpha-tubulin suppressor-like RCC1 family protein
MVPRRGELQLYDAPREAFADVPFRLALGMSDTCAISPNGQIYCLGAEGVRPVSLIPRLDRLVFGVGHDCWVTREGALECHGVNTRGQIRAPPSDFIEPSTAVEAGGRVFDLAVGAAFTCALRSDMRVGCWGSNRGGQVTAGPADDGPRRPTLIPLRGRAESVAAGEAHACAIVSGDAACWGFGFASLAGARSPVSGVRSAGLTGVTQISAGLRHSCALTGGRVACWGENEHGALGDGTTIGRATPVFVRDLGDVVEIAAADRHTCALRLDDTVFCWGRNDAGQVLPTAREDQLAPVQVPLDSPCLVRVRIDSGSNTEASRGRSAFAD